MKTLDEISKEVGKWAEHNFDVHYPHLGFAEEVGELIREILKSRQNIRQDGNLEEKIRDAIADAGVFLMHWFYLGGAAPEKAIFTREDVYSDFNKRIDMGLGSLAFCAGNLIIQTTMYGYDIFLCCDAKYCLRHLYLMAEEFKFDFEQQLNETWEEVSKRDWRKFPKNGLTE